MVNRVNRDRSSDNGHYVMVNRDRSSDSGNYVMANRDQSSDSGNYVMVIIIPHDKILKRDWSM